MNNERDLKTGEVYCELCNKIILEKDACIIYTKNNYIICCDSCYDKNLPKYDKK